jgi:hypothetical protein
MRQFFFLAFLIPFVAFNQSGMVKGKVLQAGNGLPIELAKIQMVDQQKGALSNENGDFELVGLAPGVYSFKASASGFKEMVINEITVTNARTVTIEFQLEDFIVDKKEILIKVGKKLEDKAKRDVQKYKEDVFRKGDHVRVLNSSLYANVRKLVKEGKTKLLPVKYNPEIYVI